MSKDILTIALNGEVPLKDFATAVSCFEQALRGLASDVPGSGATSWTVVGLESGSAIASVRGSCCGGTDAAARIERVVTAYEQTATALKLGQPLPYRSAEKPFRRLVGLINGRISSIRFETPDFDAEIFGDPAERTDEPTVAPVAYGAVRGRVQSLSSRAGLRFTLYDLTDDAAVSCYLNPAMEPAMREAWGQVADVEGLVRRHPANGRPTVVRRVSKVSILPERSGETWRSAIGCLSPSSGAVPPEITLREIRDAERG